MPFDGLNIYTNFGYQDDKYLVPGNAPATDIYGIQSVAAQLRPAGALWPQARFQADRTPLQRNRRSRPARRAL